MKSGIVGAVMFMALLAATVLVVHLVRVPNMYAVEGRGEVKYTPDQAEITSSIYAESDVSVDAVKESAATMRRILTALRASGVAEADVASADVRSGLLDISDNDRRAPDAKRSYYAEQIVTVNVRDISHIGKILDAIARAGSNHWLVRYKSSDLKKLEAAARKAAFLNAMETADAYAASGNFKRGRVLKIQDGAVEFPEVDYANREYRTRRGGGIRGYGSVEKIVVTGSRITEIDTTFDVPPPREQTATAETQVLFQID
jgi:uncharacterized protein YggE